MDANESRFEPPSKKRRKGIPCLDINGPDHMHSFYLFAEMDKWSDDCIQRIQQLSRDTDTHGLEVCRVLHRTVLYYKVMERDIAEAKANEGEEEEEEDSRFAGLTNKLFVTSHESPHSVTHRNERDERRENGEMRNGKRSEDSELEGGDRSSHESGQPIKFIVTGVQGERPSPAKKSTVLHPVESGVTPTASREQTENNNERMEREPSLMVVRRVVPRNPPPIPPTRQCKVEMREEEEERRESAAIITASSSESTSHHEQQMIPDDSTAREVRTIRIKEEMSESRMAVVVDPPAAPMREVDPSPLVIKMKAEVPPPGSSGHKHSGAPSNEKKKKKRKKIATATVPSIPPSPPSLNEIAAPINSPPFYSTNHSAAASAISHSPSFSFNTTTAAASFTSHSAIYNTATSFISASPSFSSTTVTASDEPSFGASLVGTERVTQEQLTSQLKELNKQILHVNTIKQEALEAGVQLGQLAIPLNPVSSDSCLISMDIFNCECRRVADEVRSLVMKFDSLHMPIDGYLQVSSQSVRREIDRIWKNGRGEGDQEQVRWTEMTTNVQKTTTPQGIVESVEKLFKLFGDEEPLAKSAEKRSRPDSILPVERRVKKRRLSERRDKERREDDEGPSTSREGRHKEKEGRVSTWCAFCKAKTSHSAIDCFVYNNPAQRQKRLRELKICFHCLDVYDPVSCNRKEHMRMCTHCGKHTSHPAMCKYLQTSPRRNRSHVDKSRKGRINL